MNICMFTSRIVCSSSTSLIGGQANAMMNLAKGLSRQGCSVTIISGYIKDEFTEEYIESCDGINFRLIELPKATDPFQRGIKLVQKGIGEILRANKESKFDLIHAHVGYPQLGVIPLLSGGLIKVPSFFTSYFPLTRYILGKKSVILSPIVSKIPLNLATKIIAISDNVKSTLEGVGVDSKKIIQIPPPIDLDRFNPDVEVSGIRRKLGLRDDEKVILFAGNYTLSKGLDVLLESLRDVLQVHDNVRFIYTRQVKFEEFDNRTKEIERILETFSDKDKCLAVDEFDFHELLPIANLFVTPFRDTSGPVDYPLSLLEAMASSKPVIASRVGGIPEIVREGETGMLVPAEDVEGLKSAINYALENEDDMKLMGERAFNLIKSSFDLNVVSKNILEEYKSVIQES